MTQSSWFAALQFAKLKSYRSLKLELYGGTPVFYNTLVKP